MLTRANKSTYSQLTGFCGLNDLPFILAISMTIIPANPKRSPAKIILLPVISAVIPNSMKPSFSIGYAHPHRVAAVSAKTDAHTGWVKMFRVCI